MGGIIVYDCTDENSFKSVEGWMKDFQESARENAPIVLIGNKSDQESKVISEEEAKLIADKFGAQFLETSAYTGENVERAFEIICEQILL